MYIYSNEEKVDSTHSHTDIHTHAPPPHFKRSRVHLSFKFRKHGSVLCTRPPRLFEFRTRLLLSSMARPLQCLPAHPKKIQKKRRILLHNVCTHVLILSKVFSLLCVFFFLDFFFRVWCLGGVSERRVIFENSDDAINLKTRKLLAEGLRYFFL